MNALFSITLFTIRFLIYKSVKSNFVLLLSIFISLVSCMICFQQPAYPYSILGTLKAIGMTIYSIQNTWIFSKTQSRILYTNALSSSLCLRMQVAYWGNYFTALDCQGERRGAGVDGAKCQKDLFFFLALTHSLAALPGWTGTLCIFQSGLKCVILSPFCFNRLLWDRLPEALTLARFHLLVQSFLLLSFISCQHCGVSLIQCQQF